jgi:CheY-like chemotaxis protein/signal transduction histidine kinase
VTSFAPDGTVPRLRVSLSGAPAAWGAVAVSAVLIGAYYLLPPDAQSIAYVVIGVLAVAGVVAGTIINIAPGQRLAWWLFAGGLACQVAGDAVFAVYEVALDREPPLPSLADAFYLSGYPLLAVGAFLLVRRVSGPFTQAAALDAVIVFLAVALVQWVFFIDQYNHEHLNTGARLTAMAYPAMDALLLTAIGQLLTVRGVRSTAYRLLVLSLVLWVVADEAYTLGVAGYHGGSWIDALWLGSYVCWAAAALHPSVGRIVVAGRTSTPRLMLVRFSLLGGALLMAPTIVIIEKALHHSVHIVVGVFGVLIAVVVLVRIAGLLRRVERARAAERDARHDAEVAHRLLTYQNEQLRQLDRLKGEFVSSVSHELRTPLTSITGYVELLLEEERNQQRRGYLHVIERSADRLLGLVSDILFAARLQDGRAAARLRAGRRDTSHRRGGGGGQAPRRERWHRARGELQRRADRRRRADAARAAARQPRLERDQVHADGRAGRGARRGGRRHRPHRRERHRHRDRRAGPHAPLRALLPLAECARARDPGHGAGALHLEGDRRGARRPDRRGERRGRGDDVCRGAPRSPMSKRPLVLCADDDEDILSLVALRLGRSGFEVVIARDGPSALALATERLPNVAVLDVMMPRLTGIELVAAFRADERLAGVKVVLLSARAQDGDQERGLEAGADAYLTKPFKFDELARVVAQLLR